MFRNNSTVASGFMVEGDLRDAPDKMEDTFHYSNVS
jgi:DNA/RNA endonuclease G (NUC1)